MFKKFFDSAAVDEFARWVVVELKKQRPLELLDSESKAAVKQRERFEANLLVKIENSALGARLNFYQKALLGSRLEEQVEAAGYPVAFGKSLSRDVVRMVALSPTLRS